MISEAYIYHMRVLHLRHSTPVMVDINSSEWPLAFRYPMTSFRFEWIRSMKDVPVSCASMTNYASTENHKRNTKRSSYSFCQLPGRLILHLIAISVNSSAQISSSNVPSSVLRKCSSTHRKSKAAQEYHPNWCPPTPVIFRFDKLYTAIHTTLIQSHPTFTRTPKQNSTGMTTWIQVLENLKYSSPRHTAHHYNIFSEISLWLSKLKHVMLV